MGVTPAEPLGDRTTEFALVLDVISAVLVALLDSSTYGHSCTLSAHKLLLLEVGVVLVGLVTVLHSTEIWILAFEAHVVRELG